MADLAGGRPDYPRVGTRTPEQRETSSLRRAVRGVSWRVEARFRVLPDFLVIGAQKAGTTSLYDELCASDRVLPARKKEVRFFDRHWSRGTSWYRWSFPTRRAMGTTRLTGEATPDYLLHPAAPARAALIVPECRLIAVVRHPVDRAHSQYRMNLTLGTETRPFEAAVDDELARLDARTDDAEWNDERNYHSYVERSRYVPQFRRWLEHFPRTSLHVTSLEAMLRDPREELAAMYRFLGVDAVHPRRSYTHANRREYDDLPASLRARLFALFADDLAGTEALLGVRLGYTEERPVPLDATDD